MLKDTRIPNKAIGSEMSFSLALARNPWTQFYIGMMLISLNRIFISMLSTMQSPLNHSMFMGALSIPIFVALCVYPLYYESSLSWKYLFFGVMVNYAITVYASRINGDIPSIREGIIEIVLCLFFAPVLAFIYKGSKQNRPTNQ